MKVQTLSGVTVFLIALISAVIGVENRYALDNELDNTKVFVKYSFTEIRIERAEDKLNELMLIPEATRTKYQQAEILRLKSFVKKMQRRLRQEK